MADPEARTLGHYVVTGSQRQLLIEGLEPGGYEVVVYAENLEGAGAGSAAVAFEIEGVSVGLGPITTLVGAHTLEAFFAALPAGDYEATVAAQNFEGYGPPSAPVAFTISEEVDPAQGYTLAGIDLLSESLTPLPEPAGVPELGISVRRVARARASGTRRASLTLELVSSAHPLTAYLTEERVVRLRWVSESAQASDGRYEWWRIERVRATLAGDGGFEVECRRIEEDLGDTVALHMAERSSATEGADSGVLRADPYISIYDLDVSEALALILTGFGVPGRQRQATVPFLPAQGPDSLSGVRVTFSAEGVSHLDLLDLLAEQAGGRLRFHHFSGYIGVSVVPLPSPGQVPVAEIGPGQTFSLERTMDSSDLVTTLVPLGGPEGAAQTVGRLQWEVMGVLSPTRIALTTPGAARPGRRGPFWAPGCLVGAYVVFEDGTAHRIEATPTDTMAVVASGEGTGAELGLGRVGGRVRIAADAEGTELVRLSVEPPATAPFRAANERVRRYEDVVPVPNLLEWYGVSADFVNATGWTLFGQIAAESVADPSFYGGAGVRLTALAVNAGLESPLLSLDPAEAPYASAWLSLRHETGAWVVELVDATGQVFGSASDPTGWIDGGEDAYALAGMEVRLDELTVGVPDAPVLRRVRLRIRCVALPRAEVEPGGEARRPVSGPAMLLLDAAALTQSAVEYEYRPGMGPHEAWHRAAEELRRMSRSGHVQYAGEIVDPRTLASLPALEPDDVVTLAPPGAAAPLPVTLPVTRIEDELGVGQREIVRRVVVGMPEGGAAVGVGAALGLSARPGSAAWSDVHPLPTRTPHVRRRPRRVRHYP